jgi:3-hydroxyisobutyrate dehydrogenase-like beta-hydroxyacid dehydrogenase
LSSVSDKRLAQHIARDRRQERVKAVNDRVGFIGLGVMGAPMARNLLAGGHALVVTTSSAEKAESFRKLGATVVDTPADVAHVSGLIFTCVPDHDALASTVTGGKGICAGGWSGLLVDCSTIAPFEARAIASHVEAAGGRFVDAPVSGGKKGAEDGTLTIMCGGDTADIDRATPAMRSMGKTIRHVGPAGAGQTVKACNQMMVAINLVGACEAIALSRANGVDPRIMREIVLTGTGRSGVLETNALRYLNGQTAPGFRIDLMKKDIGIAAAVGRWSGTAQPATSLVLELLQMASNTGLGELDTAALGQLYDTLNGTKPPESAN